MLNPNLPIAPRTLLAGLIALGAIGVWTWHLASADSFDARQFRQTDSVEAVVIDTRSTTDGCTLTARLTNRAETQARHIVLTARLLDANGRSVAVNPLLAVQRLAAGQSRTIDVPFPSGKWDGQMNGAIEVSLVRWKGH